MDAVNSIEFSSKSNSVYTDEEKDGGFLASMRVVLISQRGTIRTIWLSNTMEGRYRFQSDIDFNNALPLYIEAEGSQWIAHMGKEAVFCLKNGQKTHSIPLFDRMIVMIYQQNEEYALYAEIEREGDYTYVPYYVEPQTDYTIGRGTENQICYLNETVSWKHAVLRWQEDSFYLKDCNSTNGTYVNGHKVESERLHNGDEIFIMGLHILIGVGFVAINNANQRIEINTPKIRRIHGSGDFVYSKYPVMQADNQLFDRQPHKQIRIEPDPIRIDMPPMSISANKIPMLLRMGNPMVMGGSALMTGNYLMVLTSLIFPALTQGFTEKDRKEYEEKRTTIYRKYLKEKEEEINQEKNTEQEQLNELYPNLAKTLNFALAKKRLWERRKNDSDFLSIRIGTGNIPMIAKKDFDAKRFELERDILAEEMYALAEKAVMLEQVPVMVSLRKDYILGISGLLRIRIQIIKNMIMQLVLTHSYDEVKLVLLVNSEYASLFDFVRYLLHNWNNERTVRFFISSKSDAQQVSENLNREIEEVLADSNKKKILKKQPAYVIFALDKDLFESMELLKNLLEQEEYCGVSIIAAFDGIPKECTKIIDLGERNKLIDLLSVEDDVYFGLDLYEKEAAQASMRTLMRTKLKMESQAYSLPGTLTFCEMFGVGKAEHLNSVRRWAENNPVQSLSVPIGIATDGRLFTLDLHEKRQGPHGLVAGMTGSGKSEFLITYILSMAVNYSPDEVAFILIDYKGGGLADAFEDSERGIHLPHLVGTITNLDGASIQRSLMSIKSELTRRQTVFKEVKAKVNEGTLDIYGYQKLYRNKKVTEAMPHLFIISDEFAELKQQQPDFMDELISAARIGRSLGVHLILATQKPGGVVNNQIWSNTKFRVCLRVQDRGDSMEMLKRPEAAELKHTGRFYLQVGYNEYFAMGQSAWCGADYIPQDEVIYEQDNSVQFIDNVGQSILNIRPETEQKTAECQQVVAIVKYLSDLAKQEHIVPKKLWTEPLPKKLELEALLNHMDSSKENEISALIGMVDDPEYQCQFPLYIRLLDFHNMLLVGNAGSGKSTFLRAMLYSLLIRYSPAKLNYYILDLSNGMLNGYSRMPHCGAYLTEKNDADVGRLMNFIREIIAKRKKVFAEAEVSSFEAYCQIKSIPLILFIVDGYTNITNLKNGENYFMMFQDYLRDGVNFGVRFILTCNHVNEVGSRSRQEIDYRIALQAKDHYEYADILDVRCKYSPPEFNGRGMCVHEGRPLEYQVAILDCEKEEKDRAAILRERLAQLIQRYENDMPAECLPMVDFEQSYAKFCESFEKERIPLGYSRSNLQSVAVPFQQLHSMSLYFGNPAGIAPVFGNLLYAAKRNQMKTIVVRRQKDSVFNEAAEKRVLISWDENVLLLESTEEGLLKLAEIIMDEITKRNVLRDEYSIQHNIPLSSKGRSKRAAKYIRAHSEPIFVIIESFNDFWNAKPKDDGELEGKFYSFFGQMRGYNIYFASGFYSDDGSMSGNEWMKYYNKEGLLLLFGGRYDKIAISDIPYEVSQLNNMNPQYNQFLLKYREIFYSMVMPCGKLENEVKDPDEAAII